MAAHALCLGNFLNEEGNICLNGLLTTSNVHRQHDPECGTFKAIWGHANYDVHLLLQLLFQKDTTFCAILYIQYGQNEKPEISLPKGEKESHLLSNCLRTRAISPYPAVVMGLQRKSVV